MSEELKRITSVLANAAANTVDVAEDVAEDVAPTGFDPTRCGFGYERPSDGETNDWITPKWVVAPLICDSGGQCERFDLDPCESNSQPWPLADKGYRLGRGENGLLLPWHGRIWCNPPYGRETVKWIERMAAHNNGVMLIFARVETAAFATIWRTADAILFFPRRVTFCKPDGEPAKSGTAPSCLVAWGAHNAYAIGNHAGAWVDHWTFAPHAGGRTGVK